MEARRQMMIRYGLSLVLGALAMVAAVIAAQHGVNPGTSVPLARMPGEFEPVESILMTHHLFGERYGGLAIARAALAAGANVKIIAGATDGIGVDTAAWLTALGFSSEEHARIQVLPIPVDTQWVRDYGPVLVMGAQQRLRFVDGVYPHDADLDDAFTGALAKMMGVDDEPMPLYMDGGNLLSDGKRCYMSAPRAKAEIVPLADPNAVPKIDARAAIHDAYTARLGCTTIAWIEQPPHEHIDMYAKIVTPDTVLVGEVTDRTLALFRDEDGQVPLVFRELKESLDGVANQLSAYLKVVRIPAPVPFRGTLRNFTNALLVNGKAIVPSFASYGFDYDEYPDKELEAYYEAEVRKVYSGVGFDVVFVNADALIHNGGALHCVALQIPRVRTL